MLEKINEVEDVKKLNLKQKKELAEEIREYILHKLLKMKQLITQS